MNLALVVMGVAGCGKSSLGAALAHYLALPLVEGDDFHSDSSREKMRKGVALTDADRSSWLDALATQLQVHPQGVVLTCSALKLSYRNRLRAARDGLCFVFLEIPFELAEKRVSSRAHTHFFSSSLVQSQFATLESPVGERGVLPLDASQNLDLLTARVQAWLSIEENV